MDRKVLSFDEASELLQEGDVLLFRGRGMASFFIKRAGEGKYTHVGVASSVGENGGRIWECVEFREWKGGRTVNLKTYAMQKGVHIDVFRPVSSTKKVRWIKNRLIEMDVLFNGKGITNTMRRMTGLPYGWKRIWWIMQRKMPILRAFYDIDSIVDDKLRDLIYPVCSTAISYSFSKIGYDLTHHRADNAMEPSDIARSPLLFYVFSIEDDF